ncbi:expressed unknown protein [Seminavis robusta]|uniref:Uncharacterized protein n=1 Tax=Seminavis robusta TaxID=568900 RepID=A0A9N8E5G6_9STRA|nr:expressed unknown protein [Seminavis robusta]|eukprot:Sro639_g179690.1 n/a (629) ;mRNA; f:4333-6219
MDIQRPTLVRVPSIRSQLTLQIAEEEQEKEMLAMAVSMSLSGGTSSRRSAKGAAVSSKCSTATSAPRPSLLVKEPSLRTLLFLEAEQEKEMLELAVERSLQEKDGKREKTQRRSCPPRTASLRTQQLLDELREKEMLELALERSMADLDAPAPQELLLEPSKSTKPSPVQQDVPRQRTRCFQETSQRRSSRRVLARSMADLDAPAPRELLLEPSKPAKSSPGQQDAPREGHRCFQETRQRCSSRRLLDPQLHQSPCAPPPMLRHGRSLQVERRAPSRRFQQEQMSMAKSLPNLFGKGNRNQPSGGQVNGRFPIMIASNNASSSRRLSSKPPSVRKIDTQASTKATRKEDDFHVMQIVRERARRASLEQQQQMQESQQRSSWSLNNTGMHPQRSSRPSLLCDSPQHRRSSRSTSMMRELPVLQHRTANDVTQAGMHASPQGSSRASLLLRGSPQHRRSSRTGMMMMTRELPVLQTKKDDGFPVVTQAVNTGMHASPSPRSSRPSLLRGSPQHRRSSRSSMRELPVLQQQHGTTTTTTKNDDDFHVMQVVRERSQRASLAHGWTTSQRPVRVSRTSSCPQPSNNNKSKDALPGWAKPGAYAGAPGEDFLRSNTLHYHTVGLSGSRAGKGP